MLETTPNAHIGIVPEPLIDYRTAPASSNVKSMSKRLELIRFMISMSRLYGWENEICHTLKEKQSLSQASEDFIRKPSYGDGGMAAAVRIVSSHEL